MKESGEEKESFVEENSSAAETLRVFCAVALPSALRERAAAHIARLRAQFPHVRVSWERAEKMHVTLKFLGEIEAARAASLSRAAGRAAAGVSPLRLTLEGAGAFPPRGAPRVLWLGIGDEGGGLALLHGRLEDECAAEGFPRETRPFSAHLTLGRVRAPADARRLGAFHQETGFESEAFDVAELVVMRSELGPGGSRYTVLSRHALGGGGESL